MFVLENSQMGKLSPYYIGWEGLGYSVSGKEKNDSFWRKKRKFGEIDGSLEERPGC